MQEEAINRGVVVVLLCGLPATGKSSIRRDVFGRLGTVKITSLVFDDIFKQTDAGAWSPSLWKKSRRHLLTAALEALASVDHRDQTVILIEDNFFLSSMRRVFYKIAREAQVGFAQIELQSSESVSRHRNLLRDSLERVPVDTIERMATVFEHVGCETWERGRSFQIDTESTPIIESAAAVTNILNSIIWKTSFVPQVYLSAGCSAEHQTASHTIDLALRNLVGLVTQAATRAPLSTASLTRSAEAYTREHVYAWLDHPALHGMSVQHIAAVANAARRRVIEDIRSSVKGHTESAAEITDLAPRFAHFLHAAALERYPSPIGEPSATAAAVRYSPSPAP